MISIIIDPSIRYPEAADYFSPDEDYPEYQNGHFSTHRNLVYKAVRDCFIQAGLDLANLGTPSWNPLGTFIKPGNRVFLLCNFANERRPNELIENYRSRCSHGSIIRALADYILIATGKSGCVMIGNAPTQECHWEAVLKDTETQEVLKFYESIGAPVEAKDLRLFVRDSAYLGYIKGIERRDEKEGVHVLLNQDSLFDELDRKQSNRYRVMNYDPRRVESFHSHGHHEYVVNHHILESDVIFSAPKLKTHEKVGISCAIKGMVGTVGHKDSLPHHRYGSLKVGGDEYPTDQTGLTSLVTAFHEWTEQTRLETYWGSLVRVTYKVFRRLMRKWSPVVDGAWWGNDTAWRMSVDLARIATYANEKGELQASPCRKHLVLTDGIIGGEGDGPAASTAVYSGILTFSDDLSVADHVNALLMGFDPEKIPMIRESAHLKRYPLTKSEIWDSKLNINGRSSSISELKHMEKTHFEPQDGWKEIL